MQSVPTTSGSSTGKLWIGAGFVVLLLVIGSLAFFAYLGYYAPLPTGSVKKMPTVVQKKLAPTPTPDPTTGWKIQSTPILSFKYPPQFELFEAADGFFTILNAGVSIDARTFINTPPEETIINLKQKLKNVQVTTTFGRTRVGGIDNSAGQEIATTFVVFAYKNGSIVIERKGESIPLATFEKIIDSFSTKEK